MQELRIQRSASVLDTPYPNKSIRASPYHHYMNNTYSNGGYLSMNDPAIQPTPECTRIEVVVSEFAKGEVSVKLRRDNTLLVHALHLDQYAADNFFRKELVKTFPIPEGADVDRIQSIIRETGVLTIDIPMLRDQEAIRRSHEQLFGKYDAKRAEQSTIIAQRSSSQGNIGGTGLTRSVPTSTNKRDYNDYSTKPMRSDSSIDIGEFRHGINNVHHQTDRHSNTSARRFQQNQNSHHYKDSKLFNIAEFLQSKFSPTFTPNGKTLILKLDVKGYDVPDLSLKLFDNTLSVQGQKCNGKDSTNNNQVYDAQKGFSQSIKLPDGIDTNRIVSHVSQDNYLIIEIPLVRRM